MTTPAHTDLDSNNPQGTQSPSAAMASMLANIRALRDMVIMGFAEGFAQTRTSGTGTANQPQFVTWLNSGLGLGFRLNITWTGFNPTTVAEEWSNDSGSTWTNVATHALTFDGSQNVTACTNGGGVVVIFLESWAKALNVTSGLASHAALTGTSVHGLAGMAIQAPGSVAITGGAIDATDMGQTAPAKGDFKRAREVIANTGSATVLAAGGTYTPDLATAGFFKVQLDATTSSTATIAAPANPPSSSRTQTFTLEIVNGKRDIDGRITWNGIFHWIGGTTRRPPDNTLELAGSNLFSMRWNGASWDISHDGKRG